MTDKKKDNPRADKFDQSIYSDQIEYSQTLGEQDEREADIAAKIAASQRKNAQLAGVQGMKQLIEETKHEGDEDGVLGALTAEQELFKSKKITDREDQYHQGRLRRGRLMSPERQDYFSKDKNNKDGAAKGQQQQDNMQAPMVPQKRNYQQIMQAQMQQNEEIDAARDLKKAQEQGAVTDQTQIKRQRIEQEVAANAGQPMPTVTIKTHAKPQSSAVETASEWESDDHGAHGQGAHAANAMPNRPGISSMGRMGSSRMVVSSSINRDAIAGSGTQLSQKWDTPRRPGGVGGAFGATPRRNRWDVGQAGGATPGGIGGGFGATPSRFTSLKQVNGGDTGTPSRFSVATPVRGQMMNAATPKVMSRFGDTAEQSMPKGSRWDQKVGTSMDTQSQFSVASESASQSQFTMIDTTGRITQQAIFDERNRPQTDEELDKILPTSGYEIVKPPEGYTSEHANIASQANPASLLVQGGQGVMGNAADAASSVGGYVLPSDATSVNMDAFNAAHGAQIDKGDLPFIKPEDVSHFSALLGEQDENQMSAEELRDRKIMLLLLKIKNGTPPMRKSALKTITDKAREFGAGPLFNQILPLLMSPSLEDQERHLLVKVIDRILYKLDELVRPYVHKILVVIEPLLIDEDYYARVEGREIISNLAKAAGLATMIATMRPDIDHSDEYVRNTTARAFSVIASALGIPTMLPFLRAVCISRKSWRARHTGIKIVQQIAILMGCAVLPHLKNLVDIIEHGLKDEEQKVKTITALALSALAEAANPYGIEAFDSVLVPLMDGIQQYRGKALAAFLKAIGFIIPLMDADHAGEFTQFLTPVLIREFTTNDDEMKKIVLKVVKQAVATEGVKVLYVREEIIPEFFANFWVRRNALDKKNYKQLIDTTAEIALKVGGAEIIKILEPELKDENEQYRKILMETVEKIVSNQGVADINAKLEEKLMDGILFCFQEQSTEDSNVVLNAFGTVVNCLGIRTKPYISQMCGIIQWRLNNRSARVRQQAADLIQRIAVVMKMCDQEVLMGRLGVILYEYLGEEYPEVLGSILGALKAIVNVIGMTQMTPPIKDLLPRLTPILKNRHEKVQENCIDLVGRIADRGAEYVSAREWMRICFDLLDLLKAHKKGIRRATVNTFGYIAKAIGPQDVLATLLNNLRVQERQNRVCTTVAIAIVAETCGPFTVLPALMNEYRVPEMNVQNGVLKSLSFMFEYIGEMGKDYINAVTPLLEDALIDRDLVHRQTASSAVKHLSLGVAYMGCEDALQHLLNYLFPNIFEISPHVINAVMEGIEGLRVALGPGRILLYTLQGLFHPARRVRDVYWKIYNNMYLGAQDALVAVFPTFPDDPKTGNKYRRYEMELMM